MARRKRLPPLTHAAFQDDASRIRQTKEGGEKDTAQYNEETCCRIARSVACLGGSDGDVAEALGINTSTFERWRDAFDAFSRALNARAEWSEAAATGQAVKMALGYTFEKEKVISTREGPLSVTLRVHVPPLIEALHLLLKARLPARYGDNKPSEDDLSDARADALVRQVLQGSRSVKMGIQAQRPGSNKAGSDPDVESRRVAKIMARLGANEGDIAAALNISTKTLRDWRNRDGDFAQALDEGRELLDTALEDALLQRGIGYSYPEEQVVCDREGNLFRRYVVEIVLPDAKAGELWRNAHPTADLQGALTEMRDRSRSDSVVARHIRALALDWTPR